MTRTVGEGVGRGSGGIARGVRSTPPPRMEPQRAPRPERYYEPKSPSGCEVEDAEAAVEDAPREIRHGGDRVQYPVEQGVDMEWQT